jgi:PiT family inorganic phosphate transporter
MITFLIIFTLVIAFYMLWNMGANDVANSMGTSIGSGAITLKQALLIAAVLEFLGAFLLGSNVSETIQNGIINPMAFSANPNVLVLGMLSALLSTAIWLQIATMCKWPVSTTHAIVGAVIGFGAVVSGIETVKWNVVGTIALSWVLSPSLSALAAYLLFAYIQRKILHAYNPLHATKRIAPIMVFLVLLAFVISTFADGLENFNFYPSIQLVLGMGTLIGLIGYFICRHACEKINADSKLNPVLAAKQEEQLFNLNRSSKHLIRAKLASTGKVNTKIGEAIHLVDDITTEVKDKSKWESHISADYIAVEKIFGYLQVLSACFVAFAHGANDVANAIGPVSAIIEILKNPQNLSMLTNRIDIPVWLLLFGGAGIVIGLLTYGWRVIETIGSKITMLTPTRGFSAEFGASLTILIASKLGMPISTTHAIVGAVLGIGLARGISSLNFRLMRDIFLSWIITIPSAAVACVLIFYFLQLVFLGT